MLTAARRWIDHNILELGRELRLSYLPPLMVYMAAGISGLTSIVGTFFVKEYLGLSASFLAALGFWAGIPWALKMPIGHLVEAMDPPAPAPVRARARRRPSGWRSGRAWRSSSASPRCSTSTRPRH